MIPIWLNPYFQNTTAARLAASASVPKSYRALTPSVTTQVPPTCSARIIRAEIGRTTSRVFTPRTALPSASQYSNGGFDPGTVPNWLNRRSWMMRTASMAPARSEPKSFNRVLPEITHQRPSICRAVAPSGSKVFNSSLRALMVASRCFVASERDRGVVGLSRTWLSSEGGRFRGGGEVWAKTTGLVHIAITTTRHSRVMPDPPRADPAFLSARGALRERKSPVPVGRRQRG